MRGLFTHKKRLPGGQLGSRGFYGIALPRSAWCPASTSDQSQSETASITDAILPAGFRQACRAFFLPRDRKHPAKGRGFVRKSSPFGIARSKGNQYHRCHAPRTIAASSAHTVGLKSNGTVVTCGDNYHGQCNVSGWTDIVEIASDNWYAVGLKSDGTMVACGSNNDGRCDVSDWKLFDNFDDVVNRAVAEKDK